MVLPLKDVLVDDQVIGVPDARSIRTSLIVQGGGTLSPVHSPRKSPRTSKRPNVRVYRAWMNDLPMILVVKQF